MKTTLKHIATIQTGVFAKTVAKGDVVYLQPKYYDENGVRTTEVIPDLNSLGISEQHILKPGDVLFAAKGTKNFATYFNETQMLAAASTSFFVIRMQDKSVLPQFLTWYLNHPTTMAYLKAYARGTSVPSISKEVLKGLEITIPSLKKQQLIITINELRTRQEQIEMKLLSLRTVLNQQQLYNALN